MPYTIILLLLLVNVKISSTQESAQYLRNVIRELKELKDKSTARRIVNAERSSAEIFSTVPSDTYVNRRIQKTEVPQLSLTKGELASLYQNAVSKGHTVQLDVGDDSYINAAIHELDDSAKHHQSPPDESLHADESGYYYYYYPIKSFLDEMTSQPSDHMFTHSHKPSHSVLHVDPTANYNYHKHTHQHNVKISTTKSASDGDKKNKLEPLFMAISGFVGMAVMFVLSVLVFPKFGLKPLKPKGKHDIGDIARIALQAIEGQDCRERFACELSKTARSLNLHENRFVKLFWRVAPTSISKQFSRVYKYNNKQMKCTAIPCKKKQSVAKPNPKNNKKKTKKS